MSSHLPQQSSLSLKVALKTASNTAVQESARAAAFSTVLPPRLAVRKQVDAEGVVAARVESRHLPRVLDAVLEADSEFAVELRFSRSDEGRWLIAVAIEGGVELACQRCLQPVAVALSSSSTLQVVAHEEEARSQLKHCDPIVLDEGQLDVYGLVEDELLMALPIVALHDDTHDGMHKDTHEAGEESRQVCREGQYGREYRDECEYGERSAIASSLDADTEAVGSGEAVEKIERRSDIGADNPFEVLKTLKANVGRE